MRYDRNHSNAVSLIPKRSRSLFGTITLPNLTDKSGNRSSTAELSPVVLRKPQKQSQGEIYLEILDECHEEQNTRTVVKSDIELLDSEEVHQKSALVSETQCHVCKCQTKTEEKLVGEDFRAIKFFAAAVA